MTPPTKLDTDTVRNVHIACSRWPLSASQNFDEWLQQVKAEAWDECADATLQQGTVQIPDNPYRETEDE